jgi:hypothetical protein
MKTLIGMLGIAGLASLAAAGCSTTVADARLSALEAEVKALREELWALKTRPAPPAANAAAPDAPPSDLALATRSEWPQDPELEARLKALARLGIPLEDQSLKNDVSGLKEKIRKLEELAASMEALKAEVEKQKGK